MRLRERVSRAPARDRRAKDRAQANVARPLRSFRSAVQTPRLRKPKHLTKWPRARLAQDAQTDWDARLFARALVRPTRAHRSLLQGRSSQTGAQKSVHAWHLRTPQAPVHCAPKTGRARKVRVPFGKLSPNRSQYFRSACPRERVRSCRFLNRNERARRVQTRGRSRRLYTRFPCVKAFEWGPRRVR